MRSLFVRLPKLKGPSFQFEIQKDSINESSNNEGLNVYRLTFKSYKKIEK